MFQEKGMCMPPLSSIAKCRPRFVPLIGALMLGTTNFASAATNLVSNGNFGVGAPSSGCVAGTTSLTGWTVTSGNVDIDSAAQGCSGITAAPGASYFVDLTGSHAENAINDVGAISQDINTVAGQKYSLSFYFGGNPQWQGSLYPNDSSLKAMDAFVNGSIAGVYSVNTAGVPLTDAQWTKEKIVFTATSTNTVISFDSLNGSSSNPSDFGPLLDDVSVKAIGRVQAPEIDPASAAVEMGLLFGALAVLRGRKMAMRI